MLATRRMRVWARIAPKVVKFKTYKGMPSNDQQFFELDEPMVTRLRPSLVGKPLRYNHDDSTFLGTIGDDRVNPDGSWDTAMDLDDSTPEGASTMKAVVAGSITGVSLRHRPVAGEVDEVSICIMGARGPDARILREEPFLFLDSKTGKYTCRDDPDYAIAASHSTDAALDEVTVLALSPVDMDAPPAQQQQQQQQQSPPQQQQSPPQQQQSPPVSNEEEEEEQKTGDAMDAAATTSTDAEDAAMLADLPVLNDVINLLQGPHSIPTKAQKDAIQERVAEMEMASKDKDVELEKMRAQIARLENEKTHAVQAEDHTQRMVRDMAQTFSLSPADGAILASASPAIRAAVANIGMGVAAAATAPGTKLVVSEIARKKALGWKKARDALASPADQALDPDLYSRAGALHQQHTDPPAAHTVSASSFANWHTIQRHTPQPRAHQPYPPRKQQPASELDLLPTPGSRNWGEPIAGRTVEMVVAASAGRLDYDKVARERSKYARVAEPGAGANFNHAYFKTKQQIALWLDGPLSLSETGSTVSLKDYSQDFKEKHRAEKRNAHGLSSAHLKAREESMYGAIPRSSASHMYE